MWAFPGCADLGHHAGMSSLESLVAQMTVAELAARAGVSVGRLVDLAFTGRSSGQSSAKSSAPAKANGAAPKASKPAGKVPRGGLSLEGVLAALASVGGAAQLHDVRKKTGGTVPQVRAALQKLAGSKKVKITGKRRGTRYTVA